MKKFTCRPVNYKHKKIKKIHVDQWITKIKNKIKNIVKNNTCRPVNNKNKIENIAKNNTCRPVNNKNNKK